MKEMGGSQGIPDEVIRGHDGEVQVVRVTLPRTPHREEWWCKGLVFFLFFLKKSYCDVFCEAGLQHYKSWLRRKEEKNKNKKHHQYPDLKKKKRS